MSFKIIEKYEDTNDDENIQTLISAANIAKNDANDATNNIDITMTSDIIKSSLENAEDKLINAYNFLNIAFNLLYSKSKTPNYIEPETILIYKSPSQSEEEQSEELPSEELPSEEPQSEELPSMFFYLDNSEQSSQQCFSQEINNYFKFDSSIKKEIKMAATALIKSSK